MLDNNKTLKRSLDGNFICFLEMRTVSRDYLGHCYLGKSGIARCSSNITFWVYACFEI